MGYKIDNGESCMKTYTVGIQTEIKYWEQNLELRNGCVFCCPKLGLNSLLHNLFLEQQAKGRVHNALTSEDEEKLYRSNSLSCSFPASLKCQPMFGIELSTAMRRT